MKILVLVKTASGGAISDADASWRAGRTLAGALGSFDAHAVEAAVRLREAGVAQEIVVAAMAASSDVLGGLRDALALGADRGVLLADPTIGNADITGRAKLLAALLASERPDLCLSCGWSGDIDFTLFIAAAAGKLGVPFISQARELSVGGDGVVVSRQVENGDVTLTAPLPCIVEVTESINKARFPTMRSRLDAKRKPLAVTSIAELDTNPMTLLHTRVRATRRPDPRTPAIIVEDEEGGVERLVAFLEERRLLQ